MIIFKKMNEFSIQTYIKNGIHSTMVFNSKCLVFIDIDISPNKHIIDTFHQLLMEILITIDEIGISNFYMTEKAANYLYSRFKKHKDELSKIIIRDKVSGNIQYILDIDNLKELVG